MTNNKEELSTTKKLTIQDEIVIKRKKTQINLSLLGTDVIRFNKTKEFIEKKLKKELPDPHVLRIILRLFCDDYLFFESE